MPQIYTAISGDTLEKVSTLFYGDDSKADLIAAANGVSDELQAGQMLVIP